MNARLYGGILDGITIFTFIVQVYVFYLVQFKSPKSMKEYRYFLNTFTVWDMIFTIVASTSLAPNSVQVIFGAEVAGWARSFRPELQLFCLGFAFYSAALVIMSQDYCLIYRFTVIRLNKRLHEFFISTPSKIGWFLFQQAIAIFLGTFSYFACVQPNEFAARVALEPPEVQERLTKFVLWFDAGNSMIAIWFSITLVICFIISEILCGFLIFMIMKYLRRNSDKFSKTTYKLHRQLTLLLTFQILSPIAFILFPATACIVSFFIFGHLIDTETIQIGFIWVSFYAVSNALFTIFYITPYRHHFFKSLSYLHVNPLLVCIRVKNKVNAYNLPAQHAQPSISATSVYGLSIRKESLRRGSVFGIQARN